MSMLLLTTAFALTPSFSLSTEPSRLNPPPLAGYPAEQSADWRFSYTYLEVGAARYDVDVIDDEADVYYGRASFGLLGFLYVFGEYANQSVDFGNTDTDLFSLGAGVHFEVAPKLDLFGEIAWLYNDISSDNIGNLDDTNSGYRLGGGARWMALPWPSGGLELNGGAGVIDLENRLGSEDKPFYWNVGARAHFLEALSVGAAYEKLEDDDQVSVSLRYSF